MSKHFALKTFTYFIPRNQITYIRINTVYTGTNWSKPVKTIIKLVLQIPLLLLLLLCRHARHRAFTNFQRSFFSHDNKPYDELRLEDALHCKRRGVNFKTEQATSDLFKLVHLLLVSCGLLPLVAHQFKYALVYIYIKTVRVGGEEEKSVQM